MGLGRVPDRTTRSDATPSRCPSPRPTPGRFLNADQFLWGGFRLNDFRLAADLYDRGITSGLMDEDGEHVL